MAKQNKHSPCVSIRGELYDRFKTKVRSERSMMSRTLDKLVNDYLDAQEARP